MYGKNAHATYQNVQITTTDRGRLLLMMYEGAIKFLKQSKAGLEEKDIAKFCRFLSKGQAIIAELMNTLDFEKGGSIAKDLERLYDFMLFYLSEANLQRDGQKVLRHRPRTRGGGHRDRGGREVRGLHPGGILLLQDQRPECRRVSADSAVQAVERRLLRLT